MNYPENTILNNLDNITQHIDKLNIINEMNGINTLNNPNNPNNNQQFNNNNYYTPNNTFANVINEIDNTKIKGTNLNNNNITVDDALIDTITNEITKRLGTDKKIQLVESTKETTNNDKSEKLIKTKLNKINTVNSSTSSKNKNILERLMSYESMKDFLIIFVLFFLLSQDMIKEFFSELIPYLKPNDEGRVGIQGVVAYGLLLALLFLVVRYFI